MYVSLCVTSKPLKQIFHSTLSSCLLCFHYTVKPNISWPAHTHTLHCQPPLLSGCSTSDSVKYWWKKTVWSVSVVFRWMYSLARHQGENTCLRCVFYQQWSKFYHNHDLSVLLFLEWRRLPKYEYMFLSMQISPLAAWVIVDWRATWKTRNSTPLIWYAVDLQHVNLVQIKKKKIRFHLHFLSIHAVLRTSNVWMKNMCKASVLQGEHGFCT